MSKVRFECQCIPGGPAWILTLQDGQAVAYRTVPHYHPWRHHKHQRLRVKDFRDGEVMAAKSREWLFIVASSSPLPWIFQSVRVFVPVGHLTWWRWLRLTLPSRLKGRMYCTVTNDLLESDRMKRQSKPSRKILRQECLRNNNQLKWPPTAPMCYSRVTSFFKACCRQVDDQYWRPSRDERCHRRNWGWAFQGPQFEGFSGHQDFGLLGNEDLMRTQI